MLLLQLRQLLEVDFNFYWLAEADLSGIEDALEAIDQGIQWGMEAGRMWLGYTAATILAISVFRRK